MIRRKKDFFSFMIGIVLCLICLVCAVILISSVAESLVQKSRYEMVGATVKFKFSFLFLADILIFILSGIFGGILICKNISVLKTVNETGEDIRREKVEKFTLRDIDYGDDVENSEKENTGSDDTEVILNVPKKDVGKTEVPPKIEENKTLKINYGSSKVTMSVKDKDDSSNNDGFFSAGGDL